jgi:hypothetical protein
MYLSVLGVNIIANSCDVAVSAAANALFNSYLKKESGETQEARWEARWEARKVRKRAQEWGNTWSLFSLAGLEVLVSSNSGIKISSQ